MKVGTDRNFPQSLFKYPVKWEKVSKVDVPVKDFPSDAWTPEHAAWYRVEFKIPESARNKRLILNFDEISFSCVFLLNGKEAGRSFGEFAPVRVEITKLVKEGNNTLEIFVGDNFAALEEKAYGNVPPKNAGFNTASASSIKAFLYGSRRGIQQGVSLDVIPFISVGNVFVRTSLSNKTIEADVSAVNSSAKPVELTLKSSVNDKSGKTVLTLPDKNISLAPSAEQTVTVSQKWENPELWSVGKPNLYYLKTELMEKEAVADSCTTRFGFREFTIVKDSFYLNGVQIRLRELPTHIGYHPGRQNWNNNPYYGKPYEGAKAEMESILWANFNCTRMVHRPHPEFYYDLADELGLLVISHFPVGFYKDQYDFKNPELYENAGRVIVNLVKKERNHPSIIIWEGENEGLAYGENELPLKTAKFYKEYIGDVCARTDPTRPVKYGGDGDLFGAAAIVDMHGGDSRSCPPNSSWAVLENPMGRPYGITGATKWRWNRQKPLYLGETLYWMYNEPKSAGARFIGEEVFEDTKQGDVNYQYVKGAEKYKFEAALEYYTIAIPVLRGLDVSGYAPWNIIPGFGLFLTDRDAPMISRCRELMKPERFFLKQQYRNFYSKSNLSYDLYAVNDDLKEHEYEISWKTSGMDKSGASGSFKIKSAPASILFKKIEFTVPDTASCGKLNLVISMKKESGVVVHEESFDISVYPRQSLTVTEGLSIVVYDPSGFTSNLLKENKIKFSSKPSIPDAIATAPSLIMIGQNAFGEDTKVPIILDEYVRGGGKVLVFSQKHMKNYAPLERTDIETQRTQERAFITSPGHPLLNGISANELIYWNHPDWAQSHSVAMNAPMMFIRGNFHSVLECDNTYFTPLQELYYGKGFYIECSLDLISKFKSEPVCGKLLQNIFDRFSKRGPVEYKPLYVLRDKDIFKTMKDSGIICSLTEQVPDNGIVLVTDKSRADQDADALARFAEAGNTLWLHQGKGSSPKLAERLTGHKFTTSKYPSKPEERAVRITTEGHKSAALAGISSSLIYEKESVDELWECDNGSGISILATGGAILESKRGKGSLLIERINWEPPHGLAQKYAMSTFLHALATNLGAEIDIYRNTSQNQYSPDKFVQVNLKKESNRGFRDDVAGDGKGGWTDQGPESDLRGIKMGIQTFQQVPFDIIKPEDNGGNSCIVLYSQKNSPQCPQATKEITVGSNADKVFFLHTAAWYNKGSLQDKPIIKYRIIYDDKTSAIVEALGGKHIRDWWAPGDCELAKGVLLTLNTETETDQVAKKRGLQILEWTNPYPAKRISSIVVESGKTDAIPILLAISVYKK
ncbi:MAG: hypothetical protein A2X48_22070 [Lentisphaerae bacterium GWF2_49_21]|nr:MAG: hypothetical protein A2X48_22070 [Lentisphaerae bacterium GWF2_49_21]